MQEIEAAALRAAAELARDDLLAYRRLTTYDDYIVAPHLREVADAVMAIESGDLDRLMITMPPRTGKSSLVCEAGPAWIFGRNPRIEMIVAGNAIELVSDFSRATKDIMSDVYHHAVFPGVGLHEKYGSVENWRTNTGGRIKYVGVGGTPTGRGGEIILIDDPIKHQEEADSVAAKDKMWKWYHGTLYSRRQKGGHGKREGAIILVCTRWSDDDLSGRLLDAESSGGDKWHQIHYPAIITDSEGNEASFNPERYPLEWWTRIRVNTPTRIWQAQYMGKPSPETGLYFKKEMIEFGNPPQEEMRVFLASDFAGSEGKGDYTVHMIAGMDSMERLWILDLWRGQEETDVSVAHMARLVKRWKPVLWLQEKGMIAKYSEPLIKKLLGVADLWVPVERIDSHKDKVIKTTSIRGYLDVMPLQIPAHASWRADLVDELLRFPTGHDDQADCLGLLGNALHLMMPPEPQQEPANPNHIKPSAQWTAKEWMGKKASVIPDYIHEQEGIISR